MSDKVRQIVKVGEARFGKSIQKLFEERRQELITQLHRLDKRRREGWGYKKIRRKATWVPRHRRGAHYAMVPVKRR